MDKIGIICEYNPFHNGHIYHLNKIKELYPDSMIILVMSGNFTQRGIPSIINKWDKTDIALKYGIDLVVELPFVFATDASDRFAHGAISILKELKVDKLIFGSENNNIDYLKQLANVSLSKEYEEEVKNYIDTKNYPTALNLAFKKFNLNGIKDPNDLLALSYIKEIFIQKADIDPISIKRTNDYHSLDIETISSATSIRNAISNNLDISTSIPIETKEKLEKDIFLLDSYFSYLKYKILSTPNLEIYHCVPKGFNNKIKNEIRKCNCYDELISNIKSKHYTYNRISRMLLHILCDYTEEESKSFKEITYIRILGMNNIGKRYLNSIKKDITIPIITTFSKSNDPMLKFEQKTTDIYFSILPKEKINDYLQKEYKEKIRIV